MKRKLRRRKVVRAFVKTTTRGKGRVTVKVRKIRPLPDLVAGKFLVLDGNSNPVVTGGSPSLFPSEEAARAWLDSLPDHGAYSDYTVEPASKYLKTSFILNSEGDIHATVVPKAEAQSFRTAVKYIRAECLYEIREAKKVAKIAEKELAKFNRAVAPYGV